MDFFREGLEILMMKHCWPYYIKILSSKARDNPVHEDNNDTRNAAGAELLATALWRERQEE